MNDEVVLRTGLSTARARYEALKRCEVIIDEVHEYFNGAIEDELEQALAHLFKARSIIEQRIDKALCELETEGR